ncbi:MAG: hypothetical protein KatS3mg105_2608 [Gemmatales bacterium]|nr:MAG: hypothetical protein KatS3mg105_2608 [Gemmatales bacterium]
MSRTQQRLPLEVHEQVFAFVLRLAADKKLLHGKTVAVDSTMLEANAAMKSIVRKETGEDYKEYLRRLAEAEGIKEANDEDLRRFDQSRKDKKVSNEEWESKTDADSRIARMKDGTTRLAYKAEHVVDMQSDLGAGAATISPADHSDAQTLCDSVMQAQINVGEKGGDRGGGGRQGVSQGEHAGDVRVHEVADVHSGAEKGDIVIAGPTSRRSIGRRCTGTVVACVARGANGCNDCGAS